MMRSQREILEKLAAGEIDINQATEMLSKKTERSPGTPPRVPQATPFRQQWLHIYVNDFE